MPGHHSNKQKRQAKHIAASEKKRGYSASDAKSIGWATVNAAKTKKGMNDSSSGPDDVGTKRLPIVRNTPKGKPFRGVDNAEASQNLRAGKFVEKSRRGNGAYVSRYKDPDGEKGWKRDKKTGQLVREHRKSLALDVVTPDDLLKSERHLKKLKTPGFKLHGSGITEATNTEKKTKKSTINKGHVMKNNETLADSLNDLFKSEVGDMLDNDKPVIDCPHCDHPITKSDVLAKAGKKRNKDTPPRKVVSDNKGGSNHRGPETGANGTTPTRYAHGVPKVDNGEKITKVNKADASSDDASSGDDMSKSEGKCPNCSTMVKAGTLCKCGMMMKSDGTFEQSPPSLRFPRVHGSEHVQYVDTGEDARIANLIASGTFGHAVVTQPIDKNNGSKRR